MMNPILPITKETYRKEKENFNCYRSYIVPLQKSISFTHCAQMLYQLQSYTRGEKNEWALYNHNRWWIHPNETILLKLKIIFHTVKGTKDMLVLA